MWIGLPMLTMIACCAAAGVQLPPRLAPLEPQALAAGPPQRPARCATIYDGNLGQGEQGYTTNPIPGFSIRRPEGLIWDILLADDFEIERDGRITDAFCYMYLSQFWNQRAPADGVRIYLWGTGERPAEEPTGMWDIPAGQVESRFFYFWDWAWVEIHAKDLDIPCAAGRNWITIQPRDWTPGAIGYYMQRNDRLPLRGMDAYVKDGPDNQFPGYGFTEWRAAGESGFGFSPADSYVRLEDCNATQSCIISIEGECEGAARISWEQAPPNRVLICLYSRRTGRVGIPSGLECAGTRLGLGRQALQEAFRFNTQDGSGVFSLYLPGAACPGYFQALIREPTGPCEVSNVVATP